jgi:hypothetical protein
LNPPPFFKHRKALIVPSITIAEHMPSSNRQYAEWTIERIGREAAATGPSIAKLTQLTFESGRIPRSPRHPAPGAALRRL